MLLFHAMKREQERLRVDEPLVEGEEAMEGFGIGVGSEEGRGVGVNHIPTVLWP
jgi:hypothetical protein